MIKKNFYFLGGNIQMSKMDKDFHDWLNTRCYGTYDGVDITPQTKLVSYTYVISVFVMTFRRSTRYYFKDVEKGKALGAKLLCILCNLTLGWWGIPWGPIWVIKETFCDLADSHSKMWGEIAGRPQEYASQSDGSVG